MIEYKNTFSQKGLLMMNGKRILAILAVVILAGLYIATLVIALVDFPGSDRILTGLVLSDIALPIFLWILLYVHKHFGNRE